MKICVRILAEFMKKKFYVSAGIERFFSFLASVILIIVLNIVFTNTLFEKINANEEINYIEKCDDLAEDYASSIESGLLNLESRLDLFYAKIAYKDISPEEISKFLKDEAANIRPPFSMVVYADKNGNSWNSAGKYYDINDRNYFQMIISGKKTFYVSNIIESKYDSTPSIVLARPVYDSNHNISGMLFGTCRIEDLQNFFMNIKITRGKKFVIADNQNRFITHYDRRWVNWTYRPWKCDEKIFNTTDKRYVVKETYSADGEKIYRFVKNIPSTTWLISMTVTEKEFYENINDRNQYQNMIMFMIIAALLVALFLEFWVHSVLEKKQLLVSHIDPITHLPTRTFFEHKASRLLKKSSSSKFIMIECDIRGFKFINKTYGEERANKILYEFSKILAESIPRRTSLFCRGYADNFYYFGKINSVHRTMKYFKQKVAQMNEVIKKLEIPFSPKFGIVFHLPKKNTDAPTIQKLISHANFAKSEIKDNSLQQFALYKEKTMDHLSMINKIENHMEKALVNGEFFVMYQPKVDLNTDKVVGAEALVRWQSPELGFMPPNTFIPIFERNNFVIKLDFYVYEQVFAFIRKCLDEGKPVVPVSVNMARNHNKPDSFVYSFTTLLKKYDIPPHLIEIELLERSCMDKNILREITLMLQNEGFKVAMDDFGSGESSLNMLSSIPVNILKFDRSFLFASDSKEGHLDENSENFIKTLVNLGKNMKKETVFEGVETEEQRNFLRTIKCDKVQGYFYSKPLRENDYIDFLKSHT